MPGLGLARGAERRGSTLRTYEEVLDVRPWAGGGWEVVAASGVVRAESVVQSPDLRHGGNRTFTVVGLNGQDRHVLVLGQFQTGPAPAARVPPG